VGAGGGVPGLVLALARPERELVLVESARRKAEFLEAAAEALGLTRLRVRCARAEVAGRDPALREAAARACARALGPVATCLELTLPFVQVGGAAVLYRGSADAAAEEVAAARAAELLGGEAPQVAERTLPSGAGRRLLRVRKVARTPERFPRRDGVPRKRPLA